LAPGGFAIVEIAAHEHLMPPAAFSVLDERVYGAARLLFFRYKPIGPDPDLIAERRL
jgi:hypothetical protein